MVEEVASWKFEVFSEKILWGASFVFGIF